jgi:hypothetical protein
MIIWSISRYNMSARREWAKYIAVLALFLVMIYIGYFWQFQISLNDVRAHLPAFLNEQVQNALSGVPPDQVQSLDFPLPEVKYQGDEYYTRIVSQGEMNATRWILNNTNVHDKFVADIFGAELIMGMTDRVSTEGGDWANAPDPISMMSHTYTIYTTDNASYASQLAKVEKADYIFLPDRDMYTGWWTPENGVNYTKFDDTQYFQKVYTGDNVTIYRVL